MGSVEAASFRHSLVERVQDGQRFVIVSGPEYRSAGMQGCRELAEGTHEACFAAMRLLGRVRS